MKTTDFINVFFYIISLLVLSPIAGKYMARVYDRNQIGTIEGFIYKLLHIDYQDRDAKDYLKDVLSLTLVGLIFFFVIVIFPLGAKDPMTWHLALNTAISFVTNTNWQAYSGEVSLSPLSQMLACSVQNFVSAGTGMAVFVAFVRGLRNRQLKEIGNFWKDLTRSIIYILLPMSVILALLLVMTGVVQTLTPTVTVDTMEGTSQVIPLGPVASQEAIKQLGTNGGGYFGVNSAHPYENPTPFSNFLEALSLLLLPCALVFTFGNMLNRKKHAMVVFFVMGAVFLGGLGLSLYAEHELNPALNGAEFSEGKETRFTKTESAIWAVATTAASNGSVNTMHSSMSPLSGMVAMLNIMLGEIIFGGVGSGMYGMIVFIILTVFLSGLMVGRTPEYLQKKIDPYDMKLAIIALIAPSCVILLGSALSVWSELGLSSRANGGPHGLSEILYAWSSAAGNNGSAFAGLNANTPYYNILLGLAMLIGRFGVIIPVLLIAGNFSKKKIMAESSGQMSTDNLTFGLLLLAIILIIGALTFFPALLLGPIVEHLTMLQGMTF